MVLFLESFGWIIAVALLVLWGITLSVRYPLPTNTQDDRYGWLARFCDKYQGRPCKQMKFFIWSCSVGTVLFTVLNAYVVHK